MKQITINPNNEPYYSEDFIKGFKCGAQRQFEADKAVRLQGEWIGEADGYADGEFVYDTWYCSNCDYAVDDDEPPTWNFCPNCGAHMAVKGEDDEDA